MLLFWTFDGKNEFKRQVLINTRNETCMFFQIQIQKLQKQRMSHWVCKNISNGNHNQDIPPQSTLSGIQRNKNNKKKCNAVRNKQQWRNKSKQTIMTITTRCKSRRIQNSSHFVWKSKIKLVQYFTKQHRYKCRGGLPSKYIDGHNHRQKKRTNLHKTITISTLEFNLDLQNEQLLQI